MHSHLIPGIDDGAKDLESSVRLIRGLRSLGYRKIITTPHINGEGFPNTPAVIRAGLETVRAELLRQQIDIELHVAAEYLVDEHFMTALENGEAFLTLKDNLLLVEFSFIVPAINVLEILFDLQVKGYKPVLAHPERYLYFAGNKAWYDRLRDAGCIFQLNLLSLIGYYGKGSQQLAEFLIKRKYIDLLGTDLHHERHLEMLRSPALFKKVDRLLESGMIRNAQLLGAEGTLQ
ncbi:MAG TPA: CpsB/CapC family capsule biosynthesis tyrosine phosphatase [Puia sp.]|jgi:protein-tyrosine phosphatase|nr:CpsB/CapC family capsule biosynthesis tyrosine phosphatase [Puia sp.]